MHRRCTSRCIHDSHSELKHIDLSVSPFAHAFHFDFCACVCLSVYAAPQPIPFHLHSLQSSARIFLHKETLPGPGPHSPSSLCIPSSKQPRPDNDNANTCTPEHTKLGGIMQAATPECEPSFHQMYMRTPAPSCTRCVPHRYSIVRESDAGVRIPPLYSRSIRDACASKRLKQRGIDRS